VHLLDLQGAVGVGRTHDDALISKALEFWSSIAGISEPSGAEERFGTCQAR
jgi:hypothetical protein